mgnify:FL=1
MQGDYVAIYIYGSLIAYHPPKTSDCNYLPNLELHFAQVIHQNQGEG